MHALVTEKPISQILGTRQSEAHDWRMIDGNRIPAQDGKEDRYDTSMVASLLGDKPHWNATKFLLFVSERGCWTESKSNRTLLATYAILEARLSIL